jgi:cell division ATPase FtsA
MTELMLPESVAKSLALHLAQAHLDKAIIEARYNALLERVQAVLQTTQWAEDDNKVRIPVVATEPMLALTGLVLGGGPPTQYSPQQ